MTSQRTIDTSSTMIVSIWRTSDILSPLSTPVSQGHSTPSGRPKKEWMVLPPAFTAATPVGARTTKFFFTSSWTIFRKVVFPVPARPVRKKELLVFAIISYASFCSLFVLSNCAFIFCRLLFGFRFQMQYGREISRRWRAGSGRRGGFRSSRSSAGSPPPAPRPPAAPGSPRDAGCPAPRTGPGYTWP